MHTIAFNPKLARVGIRKRIHLYQDNETSYWKDILGNVLADNQAYTEMAQIGDFGMAPTTDEGMGVNFDDFVVPFTKQYTPLMRTIGYQLTEQADYTDIYNEIGKPVPKMMLALNKTKEQVGANVLNNAFSTATASLGPDGISLSNTSHPLQSGTAGNRPTTDVALGILTAEQAVQELMLQKSHRGDPQPSMGPFNFYVPPQLAMLGQRLLGAGAATTQPQTADRENNVVLKHTNSVHVNPYLTSATAWFVRSSNNNEHGLFLLNRVPLRTKDQYDINVLAYKYVIFEEYVAGNFSWRGFWATAGI